MYAKVRLFMHSPDDDPSEGLLSVSQQINDPELQELFGDILGPSSATPPSAPAQPDSSSAPADPSTTTTSPAQDPAPEASQEPPQAPQGAEGAQDPTQALASPENGAQKGQHAPGEVVDGSDPRPEFPEIEVPDFKSLEEAKQWAVTQEKRRRDLQAWSDRQVSRAQQGSQAAQQQMMQLQQQTAAMQQQMAVLTQHALEPKQAPIEITQEDVIEAVQQRPDETIEWIRLNVPEALDFALGQVATQHGLQEMTRLQRYIIQADFEDEREEQYYQQQQQDAPNILRQGFHAVIGHVRQRVGEQRFDAVSEQVANLCVENLHVLKDPKRNPNGVTPEAVQDFVMDQYIAAREQQFARAAAQPQQPIQLPANEVVPVGSGGPGAVEAAPDTGDALVDEMAGFQRARQVNWDA